MYLYFCLKKMKHGFRYIHSCNYQFKRKLFWTIEKNLCSKVTVAPNKRTPLEQMHAKFVDNMILAVSLKLKETRTEDPNPVHPLSYYERTVLHYHLRTALQYRRLQR